MRKQLKILLTLFCLVSFGVNVVARPAIEEVILQEALGEIETAVAQFQEVLAYNQKNICSGVFLLY